MFCQQTWRVTVFKARRPPAQIFKWLHLIWNKCPFLREWAFIYHVRAAGVLDLISEDIIPRHRNIARGSVVTPRACPPQALLHRGVADPLETNVFLWSGLLSLWWDVVSLHIICSSSCRHPSLQWSHWKLHIWLPAAICYENNWAHLMCKYILLYHLVWHRRQCSESVCAVVSFRSGMRHSQTSLHENKLMFLEGGGRQRTNTQL